MANSSKRAWRDRLGAAVCLPAALCSVLLGLVPPPAAAKPSISVDSRTPTLERQIQLAGRQGPVTLLLVEGLPISGRLAAIVGDWSDSTSAEDRYEAWRAAQSQRTPRADERITVVMNDGDTLVGAFEGVTGNAIALRTTTSFGATTAYFARVRRVLGDEGEVFGPWAELRVRLAEAPALAAVSLSRGVAGSVLVSRSRIIDVEGVGLSSSSATAGNIALGLAIGVVVALGVCAFVVNDALEEATTCNFPAGGANVSDRQFGAATLNSGAAVWPRGTTRRP